MNNTKFIKNQIQVTLHKVTAILGISIDTYKDYIHNEGTEWLLDHLHGDTLVVDDVMECKAFWTWWKLQAYHRDINWLDSNAYAIATNQEPTRLLNDWIYYHSATRLTNMDLKHAQLLYNGYANINWGS